VFGVPSLALIAATAEWDESLTVAIEAGHGELFIQRFSIRPFAALGESRSLLPADAAQATTDALIIGNGAARLIAARGWGEARDGEAQASTVRLLPEAAFRGPPAPIYGRGADAKPSA
jgi:tRNA A37 threonylcarbamoyladenosine modification protein TsaB